MTDDGRKRLATRLREAREAAGLSQEDVAQKLSLPRPAISQIENGHRRVEALELARLARLYERSLGFFADEEPVGSKRLDALHRTAAVLSEKDRAEVLRFAEFLRQKADSDGKPQ
ncbi:helix-turn-helix domain-containing protein [Myxococcus eversor]|uniref:helix-turn-helix domain-containing protein n=1 Tax=Myxococcus eversor TaxID=2709661 RepID=UPI0013D24312|nr:helix-turn-helix transcriptional regulator [Myxococcus eversor]